MGCGGSKVMVVRPVDRNGGEDAFGEPCSRGDSAVSKQTTDSGFGPEAGAVGAPLRGALPSLSPLLAREKTDRQTSSDILEQLRNQGILVAPPTAGGGGAGEAYSVMMESSDKVLQKPPARLQALKTSKEQTSTSMETITAKMHSVEERRKVKEAELKQRLRSARLQARKLQEEEGGASVPPGLEGAELETDSALLQAPPPNEEEF